MTDERDDHVVRSGGRRPPRFHRNDRRPPGAWREQHARQHPEGLAIRAVRIEEPAAVKVIAGARHVTDNNTSSPVRPMPIIPAEPHAPLHASGCYTAHEVRDTVS